MRKHPIVIACPRYILDISKDLTTLDDRIPQQLKHRTRHMGMPDAAMRLPQQIGLAVVGDFAKRLIEVGLRYDEFFISEEDFGVRWCNGSGHWASCALCADARRQHRETLGTR